MRKRILVICMFDSIHSARWLAQFQDQEIDFLLFPSSPHRRIHGNLKKLVSANSTATFELFPFSRFFGLPFWIADKFLDNAIRSSLVKRTIKNFKPEIVHALELQNAGYIASKALAKDKPAGVKLIATNWGSDIFWFQKFPKHKQKLQELLSLADAYSCECNRDVELAKKLGFNGLVMPVIPNAGGFSKELMEKPLPALAERKVIALKGYHGWVGRAKVALEALALISGDLVGHKIVVYSANSTTIRLAKKIAKTTSLEFEIHGKGKLSHQGVLEMFASAKLYVGLSLSDGISTSLLESMAMGAIPVQTETACCDEWFNETGVSVKEITPEAVAKKIQEALELAKEQTNSDLNREKIRTNADAEHVAAMAKRFYSN